MSKLALLGGEKSVQGNIPADLFKWPIITEEDEAAVLEVLRRAGMSGTDVTEKFEKEFAEWNDTKYAIGAANGTMALQGAMYACKLGVGDELICPSKTYWASAIQAFNLGATVVFADIDPYSLCISPKDLERCIGPRTKAIMAVHYLGHPCDMDPILEIANKYGIKVIEDISHAQGGMYKGRKLGTIGYVGAMSLMSGKSFATGEMGMVVTNDKEAHDRALAYMHYDRNTSKNISTDYLLPYLGMPLGGMKGRVNQTCAAMGRVQLKYYDERTTEIRKAMNYFWDLLEDVPGILPHRTNEAKGTTMGGWYAAHGIYKPEELEGLSVQKFCEAVSAEGFGTWPGGNYPLHKHAIFQTFDAMNTGKPTRVAFAERDVRELDKDLPVCEGIKIYSIPWFKKYMPEYIEMHANAFKKVAENYKDLLDSDPNRDKDVISGRWHFYAHHKDDN
ncbi:MAG: DegT/DnrJ/EryC1/StrS family aminotransferase [Oscillospiraceae bacterium]|nr:DegT/DnrJ/EryC1/StrS family aminotransferase [Oscillospiraceae bacterium]